jgi:hypothetical protein
MDTVYYKLTLLSTPRFHLPVVKMAVRVASTSRSQTQRLSTPCVERVLAVLAPAWVDDSRAPSSRCFDVSGIGLHWLHRVDVLTQGWALFEPFPLSTVGCEARMQFFFAKDASGLLAQEF